MRGHGIAKEDDRIKAFGEHLQELQGRLPKGPFDFSADLTFSDVAPVASDSSMLRRFKLAVARDARYSVASGPYLQIFGMSQGLRYIYDGGAQLQEGESL